MSRFQRPDHDRSVDVSGSDVSRREVIHTQHITFLQRSQQVRPLLPRKKTILNIFTRPSRFTFWVKNHSYIRPCASKSNTKSGNASFNLPQQRPANCRWCATGCVVECRICNWAVAGSNLGLDSFVTRSTQPSIPPGLANEYQL